jgi:membrane protease YdiL (CAAX protease family)
MSLLGASLRQSYMNMSAPAKLVLLTFLVLIIAVMGSIASYLLAIPLYHQNFEAINSIIQNPGPENMDVMKFFQIFQSIFLFVVPALMAAWLFSNNTFTYLAADKIPSGITLVMVTFSLFLAVPLMNEMTYLNTRLDLPAWLDGVEGKMIKMEESAGKLTELFLETNSSVDLMVNFLMIAILPAIGEEFLFRGVLQRLFIDWTRSNHWGIVLSAFLFSFFHFQFFGFLPRFLLGLYFGYLMLWSASIWVPVTAHFINNGIAVIYYHFSDLPAGESPLDTIGTADNSNYLFYLSVFFTCLILGMIYLHEKRRRTPAG